MLRTSLCSLLVCASLLSVSACDSPVRVFVATAKVAQPSHPQTNANAIRLYRSTIPSRDYEEIGSVMLTGRAEGAQISQSLREQAAALGGDAVIECDLLLMGMAATVVRYTDKGPER